MDYEKEIEQLWKLTAFILCILFFFAMVNYLQYDLQKNQINELKARFNGYHEECLEYSGVEYFAEIKKFSGGSCGVFIPPNELNYGVFFHVNCSNFDITSEKLPYLQKECVKFGLVRNG